MESNPVNEEYEIQIFKFSVKQMQIDTESIIKKRTSDFITSLFRTLAKRNLINEDDARLAGVRQQIINNILLKIKRNVRAIHEKFAEYFTIPDNVVLLENLPHEKYCNNDRPYDIVAKRDKITSVETELLQLKLFRKKLELELDYHREMDKFLVDEEAMIGIVKSILSEGNLINDCKGEEIIINKLRQINESLSRN